MICLIPLSLALLLSGNSANSTPPIVIPPAEAHKEHKGHAVVEVRTDVGWVGPSQTFNVIVNITPDEGWHVYWKNPGASGAPTEIDLNLPEGFVAGEFQYPRPTTFQGEEGQTYGYDKSAAIFIPVTSPEILVDGQVQVEVETYWLACKQLCVMGEQKSTLKISTNNIHQGPLHRDMQLSRWFAALPAPLDDLEEGGSVLSGNTLFISGESAKRPIRFIGIEQKGVRFGNQEQLVSNGNSFRIPIPIYLDFSAIEGDKLIVEGILMFGRKSDDPSYVVQLIVDSSSNLHEGKGN